MSVEFPSYEDLKIFWLREQITGEQGEFNLRVFPNNYKEITNELIQREREKKEAVSNGKVS